MPTPADIIDLIDAGLGNNLSSASAPIDQTYCARQGCYEKPEGGHDFCVACLAWLRFEVDDDPLANLSDHQTPPVFPPGAAGPYLPPDVDPDEWAAHIEAAVSNYT